MKSLIQFFNERGVLNHLIPVSTVLVLITNILKNYLKSEVDKYKLEFTNNPEVKIVITDNIKPFSLNGFQSLIAQLNGFLSIDMKIDLSYLNDEDFNELIKLIESLDYSGSVSELIQVLIKESGNKFELINSKSHFTPNVLSEFIYSITSKDEISSILDSSIGVGSLVYPFALTETGKEYTGYELNRFYLFLSRLEWLLNDLPLIQFKVYNEDYLSSGNHRKYDLILSNPPFSSNWKKANLVLDDTFFNLGDLPPQNRSESIFLIKEFNSLSDKGYLYSIVPNGILFRGGVEKKIRKVLVKERYLNCIIQLPERLFANTSIACSLLVTSKIKEENVLIGQLESEDLKDRNIINSIKNRCNLKGKIRETSFEEILERDFNLSPNHYFQTINEEQDPSLADIIEQIKKTEIELSKSKEAISQVCSRLEIESPF